MLKQTVKTRARPRYSQNNTPVPDWVLTGLICSAVFLAVVLIWGIGQALGL